MNYNNSIFIVPNEIDPERCVSAMIHVTDKQGDFGSVYVILLLFIMQDDAVTLGKESRQIL